MNISSKLDINLIQRFTDLSEVMKALGIPFLVVGASARDIFFEYAFDIKSPRRTNDLDIGIQVPGWHQFENAKSSLSKLGYRQGRSQHRMIKGNLYPLDIIPFGALAKQNKIAWPPDGGIEMNVSGFDEAFKSAVKFLIDKEKNIEISVASVAGLTLMKLIAWTERDREKRGKDAEDIKFMLSTYEQFPFLKDEIYDLEMLEKYDGDTALIGADLLGKEVSYISQNSSKELLVKTLQDTQNQENLAFDMDLNDVEFSLDLLIAFKSGLVN